ncbi:MAG: class I SAM-dependent RNA methyltransferase [Halobacteriovoraceae bacterium]|jgi:23S rRNA (uracil1939-C5)-methyltransferase|nr:class I SAM-dependent RNA methyltransferase [Halobacteriovoraceae bacterium]MBT5092727.1 class I SAM-dependent RNA methyltransferase [Halobacteriovoraceae bacterium]
MKKVQFEIEHIDPLGQGVSKKGDKVTFIPKTLPGETGVATIVRSRKGVQFAELTQLDSASAKRIEAECPHYDQCNGCHFLHTSYPYELELKQKNLEFLFKNWQYGELHSHPGPTRMGYRNRIQLHFNKARKQFGFMLTGGKEILAVPDCLLPAPQLKAAIKQYTGQDHWLDSLPDPVGHVEFYQKDQEILISCNKPYAEGGFSQVNPAMNQLLAGLLQNLAHTLNPGAKILDLFGGVGNLSSNFQKQERLIVDYYPGTAPKETSGGQFLKLDLYRPEALNELTSRGIGHFDCLIVDPPRSGFKQLGDFLKEFSPELLIYVSCNPATLKRDLDQIKNDYQLSNLHLLDFFPGTFHFETLAILKKL